MNSLSCVLPPSICKKQTDVKNLWDKGISRKTQNRNNKYAVQTEKISSLPTSLSYLHTDISICVCVCIYMCTQQNISTLTLSFSKRVVLKVHKKLIISVIQSRHILITQVQPLKYHSLLCQSTSESQHSKYTEMNTHYQLLDTYSHNILTYSTAHHAAEMLVLNVAIKLSFCTIFSPRSPCGHKPHLLDDIRVLTCKTSKAITNILKEHTTSIFMVYNFLTPIQDRIAGMVTLF